MIQLHTWEPQEVAEKIHREMPLTEVALGIGIDGIAKRVARNEWSVEQGRKTLLTLARRATDIGAAFLKFNAEAGWKRPPNTEERRRLSELITTSLTLVSTTYPSLLLYHTAYDHPTFHSSYLWKEWIGKGSPILASYPQVYAAGSSPGDVEPHRGALQRREKASLASWKDAIKKNWIDQDIPDGQPGDDTDVDFRPYFQLHHVHAFDTVAQSVHYPNMAGWAVPTRADKHGRAALIALCRLYRRGFWGPDAIRSYQASVGLKPDGIVGPMTMSSLGATVGSI